MLPSVNVKSVPVPERIPYGAAALAVASLAMFPAADALAKSLADHLGVLVIVWARLLGSAVLISPIWLWQRPGRPTRRAVATEALRAVIIIAAFGSFVLSFRTIPFAEAMTYYSFAPIVASVLAVLVLKERMTAARTLALMLGLIGVLVALNPGATPAVGAYFAMLTGCLYGGYLFLNRVVAVRWHPIQALFLQFWIGAILLTPLVWTQLGPHVVEYLPRLAAIAGVSVICNVLLIYAFRMAEASFLAPFMYIEIPSALLMAVVFLGETPSLNLLLGAAMILGAGLLVIRPPRASQMNGN
ncbi:DMT family transporter (plasmid) [Aliisedimentitalea scapharcae]|uniref:DMT family transporter n=1 Tax=Aliisedimentitalea scapharcae TaxID=1524259 RepID=A0ABZ2XYC5_9RHOB